MTITEFERNSVKICHDKKFRSELFKNSDSLTWKNCFSILRTTNMFMRPRIQKLNFYDLDGTDLVQRSSLDSFVGVPADKDILILENICQEEEIQALDGLRFLFFFMICVLFVNYVNIDMVIKNRWKSFEMIEQQRLLWIFVSSLYINIDYLLLLSAFL